MQIVSIYRQLGLTYQQIAQKTGISRERVRQLWEKRDRVLAQYATCNMVRVNGRNKAPLVSLSGCLTVLQQLESVAGEK